MFINQYNRIDGTRVTVWDVYLYSRNGDPRSRIAHDYGISEEQVQVALDYIEANKDHVEKVHQQIEERNARGNSPEVRALIESLAPALELKKKAIRERAAKRRAEAHDSSHSGGSQSGRIVGRAESSKPDIPCRCCVDVGLRKALARPTTCAYFT